MDEKVVESPETPKPKHNSVGWLIVGVLALVLVVGGSLMGVFYPTEFNESGNFVLSGSTDHSDTAPTDSLDLNLGG